MLIKLFGSLRMVVPGGRVEVGYRPTVADLLDELFAQHPALRAEVLHPDRMELLPHVNIMLNGRLVRDLQGLQTAVADGDTLAIFPPSAGG